MTKPYIGGQAVIEGVMMRSPKSFVVAVRRPDASIAVRELPWNILLPKVKFLRWPIFRGAVVLAESLHNGFSALKFSAEHGVPADGKKASSIAVNALWTVSGLVASMAEEKPRDPKPPNSDETPSSHAGSTAMLVMATALMVCFFIALPHILTFAIGRLTGASYTTGSPIFHLIDGVMRLVILVGYIGIISRTQEAKRLFQFHGAEHKSIWTYELGKALRVKDARPMTTLHPRCGTSFLFIVVGVSVLLHIVLLPFVPRLNSNEWVNQALMVLIKIPMAFPIAGIAYELQRWSAKDGCPRWIKWLTLPGMWMQRVTTQEPDDAQLEISLLSLERALAREEGKTHGADGVKYYANYQEAIAVQ